MTTAGRSNYYKLTNKSGGTVTKGQTVTVYTSADNSFTTSTTSPDFTVMGEVIDDSIANNASGLIQINGSIVPSVLTSAAVTRGHYVKQGTTAGKVVTTGTLAASGTQPPSGAIGIALTGVGGAGTIVMFALTGGGGASTFLGLTDTPSSYTGDGRFTLQVNSGETALAFKYMPWFDVSDYGALGDDSTNDYTAIAAAVTALQGANGGVLYFPKTAGGGKYRHGTAITIMTQSARKPIWVVADSGVQVRPTADIDSFYMKMDDSQTFSDISTTVVFVNIWVNPVTTGQATGFHVRDSVNTKFERCIITNAKKGILLETYNSWTEMTEVNGIIMDNNTTGLEFLKTTGQTPASTGSFQRTSVHAIKIRTASGGTGIKIGTNANVYGSTFDVQIWPVGNNCIGIDVDGDLNHSVWHGIIDLAGSTPSPAWALRLSSNTTNATLMEFDVQFAGTYATGEQESGAVKNATPIRWFHTSKLPYGGKSRGAKVQRTSTQNINNTTDTAISFDASLASGAFDESGYFASGSPTRLTIPWDGTYAFGATVFWDSNTTGRRDTKIRLNGSSLLCAEGSGVVGANELQSCSTIKEMAAGDYIELVVYQDSGGTRTVIVDTLASVTFWIYRIGEGPAITGPQ